MGSKLLKLILAGGYCAVAFAGPADLPTVELTPEVRGNEAVTYGFEVEFRGTLGEESRLISPKVGGVQRANYEAYPFLSSQGLTEIDFITREVISLPTPYPKLMFQQMRTLPTDWYPKNPSVGGIPHFHFRVRVPKSFLRDVSEADLKGWVSRLGDVGEAFLLQNKHPSVAIRRSLASRNPPSEVGERGATRLLDLGNHYDIEIRSIRDSIETGERIASLVLAGVRDPKKIKGFPLVQEALHVPKGSIADLSSVAPSQIYLAHEIEREIPAWRILPLMAYQDHPILQTPDFSNERKRLLEANANFESAVSKLLTERAADRVLDREALIRLFEKLVQDWAIQADLFETLAKTIQYDGEASDDRRMYDRRVEAGLDHPSSSIQNSAITAWLQVERTSRERVNLAAWLIASPNTDLVSTAINAVLAPVKNDSSFALLKQVLYSPEARKEAGLATIELRGHRADQILPIFDDWISQSRPLTENIEHALRGIPSNIRDPWVIDAIERIREKGGSKIESETGLISALSFDSEASIAAWLKALLDPNEERAAAALHAYSQNEKGHPFEQIVGYVKKRTLDMDMARELVDRTALIPGPEAIAALRELAKVDVVNTHAVAALMLRPGQAAFLEEVIAERPVLLASAFRTLLWLPRLRESSPDSESIVNWVVKGLNSKNEIVRMATSNYLSSQDVFSPHLLHTLHGFDEAMIARLPVVVRDKLRDDIAYREGLHLPPESESLYRCNQELVKLGVKASVGD